MVIKRGDIFYADLSPVVGSEQDGIRPDLIIQNNLGNKYSPTIIALAITTKLKPKLPTHIPISKGKFGLNKNSVILVEQVRTLDKSRLKEKVGNLDKLSAGSATCITLIFIGALLTGLGVYDLIGKRAGAGSIVPITGFANSVVSPAMEFKREGFVLGVGANLFKIAGPVLVYGIGTSIVCGFFYYIFTLIK